MSSPHPLPPKKEVALALLERSSVHVHLDPRAQGVAVPAWFKKQPQLVLQIGLNMPVPIPDLRLDDEGMTCTLSFSRQPFYCIVPWTSVFAMVGDDGRGMVWPDDVPPEIASQAKQAEASSPAVAPKRPAAKRVSPIEVAPVPQAAQSDEKADAKSDQKADEKTDDKSEKPAKTRKSRAKKSRAGAAATTAETSAETSRQTGAAAEPELRPVLVAVPSASRDDRREERVEKRADKRGGARPEPREAPRPEAARARFEKAEKSAEKATPAKTPERIERPQPQPQPQHRPQPRPMSGPPKVKRELPPYLRVVK